jgi:hypothetical protein
MTQLLILLLRQRGRRVERQYGWQMALSLAALLMLVLWRLAVVVSRLFALGSSTTLATAFAWLWTSWMIFGVMTGRDLTWHVRIDRLMLFRVPFYRLYVLDVLLGFVSYPLLALTAGITLYAVRSDWTALHWSASIAAFFALVLLTRLAISMIRTVIYRGHAFRITTRVVLLTAIAALAALTFIPATIAFNPGRVFARAFLGIETLRGIAFLALSACLLMLVDYAMQRHVVLSGVFRPAAAGAWLARLQERFLLSGSQRSILWRISMLGWLRNRNALLLFIWGTAYGFFYTWLTHATGLSYYLSFAWMVLVFHSYLRGNLFGIDQKGVWMFFVQPLPLRRVLSARSASMSVLQAVMIGAVLLCAVARPTAGMTTPFAWVCVLSFSVSALLAAEVAGQLFSVLHPDPIERGSLYSGGMTFGAFVIPMIHVAMLVLYLVAVNSIPARAAWALFIGLPSFLVLIRWRALPIWINRLLSRDREEILMKMSAVTP